MAPYTKCSLGVEEQEVGFMSFGQFVNWSAYVSPCIPIQVKTSQLVAKKFVEKECSQVHSLVCHVLLKHL